LIGGPIPQFDTVLFYGGPDEHIRNHDRGFYMYRRQAGRLVGLRNREWIWSVVHAAHSHVGFRAINRAVFRRSGTARQHASVCGVRQQTVEAKSAAPIAVVDLDDPAVIARSNLFSRQARSISSESSPPTIEVLLALCTGASKHPV